jgi:hypothetical protein
MKTGTGGPTGRDVGRILLAYWNKFFRKFAIGTEKNDGKFQSRVLARQKWYCGTFVVKVLRTLILCLLYYVCCKGPDERMNSDKGKMAEYSLVYQYLC